jgi:ketosteroid isomerase-like protein
MDNKLIRSGSAHGSFRDAVDRRDMDAVDALLADDVVLHSPVAHRPYLGKPITSAILRGVAEVLEDFHYVREIQDPNGRDHALVFQARLDDLVVTGCDFLQLDGDGRIVDLMVMVRPLKAAEALAERMAARFEQIQAAAPAGSAR